MVIPIASWLPYMEVNSQINNMENPSSVVYDKQHFPARVVCKHGGITHAD